MMLSTSTLGKLFSGTCPAQSCGALVIFSEFVKETQCSSCKVRYPVSSVIAASEIRDSRDALLAFWKLLTRNTPVLPKSPVTKVLGLSTYHCKLLSPLLTRYGIDRVGRAKPIQELKNCATFDCSWLGDRSFCIDPDHIMLPEYGQDESGSVAYLAGTLSLLRSYNNDRDALVPLHVDGDGHCLVHAVSRAIVGRELFWHALRTGLKLHFEENLPQYKALLSDFINSAEWTDIIAECDPDYSPCDNEMLGLRNVHIFGLANVLRRPILLVDSVAGMQSSGDYSALFLPGLISPEQCRDRNGELNKPICIAWSSSGRNHYIPLVGIKGCNLPMFPRSLLPKVWGVSQSLVENYIDFNEHSCLVIGGSKLMQDSYLLKLASGMNALFRQKHGLDPSLVADTYYCNFKKAAAFDMKPSTVLSSTKSALQERRLVRCLNCSCVNLLPLNTDWLRPHGLLYNIAKKQSSGGILHDQHLYTFHNYGVSCIYNARKDVLVVETSTNLDKCLWCESDQLRLIHVDGNVLYENGDKTTTLVDPSKSRCKCGYKHWYNGREYDNPPLKIPICFEWKSRRISEEVLWFQDESNPLLNSDPHQIAAYIIHKHFPGDTSSARARLLVVDLIQGKVASSLQTATPIKAETVSSFKSNPESHSARNRPLTEIMKEPPQDNTSISGQATHLSEPGLDSKQSSNLLISKKRHSDDCGGAVPKQRSMPASLAAAAAINRAAASQGASQISRTTSNPVPPLKDGCKEVLGQKTIRLGPGYSVMSSKENDELSKRQNVELLQQAVKTTEILAKYFSSFSDLESHTPRNPSKAKSKTSNANSKGVSLRGQRLKNTDPTFGSLSRVANLLNVGGNQDLSDCDDCLNNSEDDDPM